MTVSEFFKKLFSRKEKIVYYVHDHWGSFPQIIIHKGNCLHCNQGKGKTNRRITETGRWLGPYKSFQKAERVANEFERKVRNCNDCIGE